VEKSTDRESVCLEGADRAEAILRRGRWIGVALLAVVLGVLAYRAGWREGCERAGDTRFYQRGAQRYVAGTDLYRWAVEERPPGGPPTTGYTYLPSFAALAAWMAPLPYRALRLVWLAAMAGCMVLTAALLLRLVEPSRPCLALVLAAVVLARFALNDLAHGQVNWLVTLLLVLTLVEARRGRDLRAGAWLAFANLLKPTSGLLVFWYLLADRRPRLVAVFVAAFGGGVLLASLRYGAETPVLLESWWLRMNEFAAETAAHPGNGSLASAILRLLSGSSTDGHSGFQPLLLALDPEACRPVSRLLAVAAVAALFAAAAALRRRHLAGPLAVIALGPLLSPVAWKAHLVVLLLPLGLLARRLAGGRATRLDWGIYLAVALLVLLPSRGLAGLSILERCGSLSLVPLLLVGWSIVRGGEVQEGMASAREEEERRSGSAYSGAGN
jgi:hypothetical protein